MGLKLRFVQAPPSWSESFKELTKFPSHQTLRVDKFVGGGNYVADLRNLVFQIKQECAQQQDVVDELRISGHGSNVHMRIGKDAVTWGNLFDYADLLKQLIPLLNPRGIVIFENCHAGENLKLLSEISRLLGGITVAGRDGLQDALTGPDSSEWKVTDPSDNRQNSNVG